MKNERTKQTEVTDRAYQLWEKAGRPEGRDLEFWVQAEAQVGKEAAQTVAAPAGVIYRLARNADSLARSSAHRPRLRKCNRRASAILGSAAPATT
jgi:hypothetical protein